MSLSVVFVPDTGHVVGALALTAASASTDVTSLVGKELPLRISLDAGEIATISLSTRQLGAAAVDDEAKVFSSPMDFGVEMTPPPDSVPKPALVPLRSWFGGVELKPSLCVVTLPVEVTRLTPVHVLISDGEQTHVLTGEIAVGGRTAELPVTLTAGNMHGVLVLVPGWAGRFEALSVS